MSRHSLVVLPTGPATSTPNVPSSETTWAVRGLPLNDELYLCTFLDVRVYHDLLPYPRDWFVQRIHEHFMAGGGPLRLVPWTVEEAETLLKFEDPNEPVKILVRKRGVPVFEYAALSIRSA